MKSIIWMLFVFFGLIYIAPVLMIIMVLAITDIPMHYAAIFWLPFAIIGTLLLSSWYRRQGDVTAQG